MVTLGRHWSIAVPIDVVNSKKMWSPVTALTVTVLTVTVQVASDSGHKQLESRVPVFFSIADDNGHGRRESRVTEIEVVGNGSRWRLWLRTTRVAGDRRCITGDGDRGQNSHVGEMFKQYRFFSWRFWFAKDYILLVEYFVPNTSCRNVVKLGIVGKLLTWLVHLDHF